MSGPPIDPVERYLGADAAAGGPFAILGLRAADATPNAILHAVDEQMRRIDAHDNNAAPDADEVRLVVHAAAARLLDASTRQALFEPVPQSAGGEPAPVHIPAPIPATTQRAGPTPATKTVSASAPSQPTSAAAVAAFRRELGAAIALSGGWNSRARRRLMLISARRGISVRALAVAARASGTSPGGARPMPIAAAVPGVSVGPGAVPPPIAPRVPREAVPPAEVVEPDPAATVVRWVLGILGVAFVGAALTVIVVGIQFLRAGDPGPRTTQPEVSKLPEADSGPEPAPEPPAIARAAQPDYIASRDLDTSEAVIREFRDSITLGISNPSLGSVRVERAIESLSRRWPLYTPERVDEAHAALVEFIFAAANANPDNAIDTVEAIAAPLAAGMPLDSNAIAPVAWSTGFLTRLRRERDLAASVTRAIDRALISGNATPATDARTFEGGAGAALRFLADDLSTAPPSPSWQTTWEQWADTAHAAGQSDPALRAALFNHALHALLSDAESPLVDRHVGTAIEMLGEQLKWRADDGSRSWFLNELTNDEAKTGGLVSLTNAIAQSSSAEGIDASMVLKHNATMLDRRELRDAYAKAWGLAGGGPADRRVLADWLETARERVDLAIGGDPSNSGLGVDIQAGARAAVMARLNAAASAAWQGDDARAFDMLDALETPVNALTQGLSSGNSGSGTDPVFDRGGGWAQRYLLADRNLQARVELLDALAGGRRLGSVDAEVLVHEAIFGSNRKIREGAMEIVIGPVASQPTVVNGALELLWRMPKTKRSSEFVETVTNSVLPSTDDPTWRSEARRVLVERLLELIASTGPSGVIDGLGVLIRDAYAMSLGLSGRAPDAAISARLRADRFSGQVARALPTGLPSLSLRSITTRRDARLGMSDGLLQSFAAEQAALVEIMAALLISERPGTESRVAQALDRLAGERRRANHVLEQIAASEVVMTELWMLRFGGLP
ncbi:MAG: hypothetical protein AAGI53_11285 [Planctomycetota bacterium]